MAWRPDSQQSIHEPLADIGNPGKAPLWCRSRFPAHQVAAALRFVTQGRAGLKQFDYWPGPDLGDYGIRPFRGKAALRVAMTAWSTGSAGSWPSSKAANVARPPRVIVSGAAWLVTRDTYSRHGPGVAAQGSSGRPAASNSRWVQLLGTTCTCS